MSDVWVREQIAKHLAFATGDDEVASPGTYWESKPEFVKVAYRLRAAKLVADLQAGGYRIVSDGEIDDQLDQVREEAYDRGRLDERELFYG